MMMKSTYQCEAKVFYSCVSKPLLVFRFLGLLPIEGLFNPHGSKTRVTVKSLYTIYLGLISCCQTVSILIIYHCALHKEDTVSRKPPELLMAMTFLMVCICLIHLSKNWTQSLQKIEYMESLLPPLRSRKILLRRIKCFTCVMWILCFVNFCAHTIYLMEIVNNCFLLEGDSGWHLKSYFLASDYWLYHHFSFSYVFGFITQMLKLEAFFISFFADILIVVVTAYLTCRVKQFYGCLVHKIKNENGRKVSWSELQAHFSRLTTLVVAVDDLIGPFIVTSFFSHLLFTCKSLWDVLRANQSAYIFLMNKCVCSQRCNIITAIAFAISFFSLFLRSFMITMTTVHLHTLGRKPLNALHYVPTSMYNDETQRLMDQVYHSKIGLSGLRFFYITQGTVLSMISTVLTYELVLLQIRDD